MCDVFISYAHEDRCRAKKLSNILEFEGFDVWYDEQLRVGERLRETIGEKIDTAKRVIVLWSRHSIDSHWVLGEASSALEQGKLIPLLVEEVDPPLDFRDIHTADFASWDGSHSYQGITDQLLPALKQPDMIHPESPGTMIVELPFSKLDDPDMGPGTIFRDWMQNASRGPKMVVIPHGQFIMGSSPEEAERQPEESPQHQITIPRNFAMGVYPVTFQDYMVFAEAEKIPLPSDQGWGQGTRPVINVSWNDAIEYCNWLSNVTGRVYRLPSETEWEYAARGNTKTRFSWGDDIGIRNAHCDGCDPDHELERTLPVGSFSPNPFGLYDIHGNVFEWCQDRWHANYCGIPEDGSAWMSSSENKRVIRGGSWIDHPKHLRSANRYSCDLNYKDDYLGFRVVREL